MSRRLALLLLLLVLGVCALAGAVRPVRAAPRFAQVNLVTAGLTSNETFALRVGLETFFSTYRQKADAWQCVAAPAGDTDLAPLAPDVEVYAVITGNPEEQGGFIVSVRLTIRGQGGPWFDTARVAAAQIDAGTESRDLVLGRAVWNLLGGLMNAHSPCPVKAKLQGKQRIQTPFGSAETSYSGDASLVLREDGSFEANMAVGLQWLTVLAAESLVLTDTQTGGQLTAPDGACTWSSPFAPSTFNLDFAGSYRAQDGSLVFTRLHSSSPSIDGIMTCRFVAPDPVGEIVWTNRWSYPAVESDVLAMLGGEAALTLADGATLAFPRPPAFQGEYDVSLTLAYGSEGGSASASALGAWHGQARNPR